MTSLMQDAHKFSTMKTSLYYFMKNQKQFKNPKPLWRDKNHNINKKKRLFQKENTVVRWFLAASCTGPLLSVDPQSKVKSISW